ELPYRLKTELLSAAELEFYRVLRLAVGAWAVICPKVGLGDLFYPQTGNRSANTSYRNRIDRKHVDFVLCDPHTMRPLVGIELDDASHRRASREKRDRLVNGAFAAAGRPLERFRAASSYDGAAAAAAAGPEETDTQERGERGRSSPEFEDHALKVPQHAACCRGIGHKRAQLTSPLTLCNFHYRRIKKGHSRFELHLTVFTFAGQVFDELKPVQLPLAENPPKIVIIAANPTGTPTAL
ncbi:MAG: DUF2726 domain-containing protein, partial [Ardenticatenales bacterium]|nr:DUF2726 domain-containing protein [Ardenticatenales bacterium]